MYSSFASLVASCSVYGSVDDCHKSRHMTAYVSMRLEEWHDIFGDEDWEEHFLKPAREKMIAEGFKPGRVEVTEDYITMWSEE